MKRTTEDYVLDIMIYVCLLVLVFLTLYPFWNSVVISFNDGNDTAAGGVTFWPRAFTLENYRYDFKDNRLIQSFGVTVARTAVGTFLSILFTSMFAYAMAKRDLIGKKFYMIVCVHNFQVRMTRRG